MQSPIEDRALSDRMRVMGQVDLGFAAKWSTALTAREREIALLVARGWPNKQVARALGLSTGTVKMHLHRIFQKLGIANRRALILQVYLKMSADKTSRSA
jgi:DNA-binding NarL/FixJ family response regulator